MDLPLGVEKAWTQLCWMRTRREFFTCPRESSRRRTISCSDSAPWRRRQPHTFCEGGIESAGVRSPHSRARAVAPRVCEERGGGEEE